MNSAKYINLNGSKLSTTSHTLNGSTAIVRYEEIILFLGSFLLFLFFWLLLFLLFSLKGKRAEKYIDGEVVINRAW